MALWVFAFVRFFTRITYDRMHGRISEQQWGIRLRHLFQEMGGAAIKIGQQLSVRIDLLPYAICLELERLVDRIPAFPLEQAIDRIERTVGKKRRVERVPLNQIFKYFDPEPIGSASIACVYQAVLLSGERVAVKVQRPGIRTSIAADLGVIDLATRTLEALAMFPAGFFGNLRAELRTMLSEELNFALEARYQRLFRYFTKRDKLKWVTAPKVYTPYCSQEILVTEFISGFSCTEILAAGENNDVQALSELAAKGIIPKEVGKRLMEYSFYSRYELPFFHADPHHGNIFVLDGGKLMFVDFGSCGITSRQSRMSQLLMMDRISRNDISGTADAAIGILEPLPLLDVYAFRKALEAEFGKWLFAFRDKKSEWWERTTAGLWLVLLGETRKRHIPVGLETVRLTRSLILIDTLCYRLYPKMVSPNAFIKYERKAMRRGARKAIARIQNAPLSHYSNTLIKEGDDALSRLRYVAWQVERVLDSFPKDYAANLSKLSTVGVELLRIIRLAAFIVIGVYFYISYGGHYQGHEWSGVVAVTINFVRKPVILSVLLFLGFRYYRRIGFRTRAFDLERRWNT